MLIFLFFSQVITGAPYPSTVVVHQPSVLLRVMKVCMHACMYVYVCVCIIVHQPSVLMRVMKVCMYACMYVRMYVCVHYSAPTICPSARDEDVYVCMHVCMYVCMYLCILVHPYASDNAHTFILNTLICSHSAHSRNAHMHTHTDTYTRIHRDTYT